MFSIRLSTLALIVPFGAAIVFLLWFLWNLLHESKTITFRLRSLLRTRRHPSNVRRLRQLDR
jgi:hypothetical protein